MHLFDTAKVSQVNSTNPGEWLLLDDENCSSTGSGILGCNAVVEVCDVRLPVNGKSLCRLNFCFNFSGRNLEECE